MVDDSDAPITPYVYWVVFDIGPGTSALLEGQLPPGALQARGTAGYDRYDPPCPGQSGHSYRFTVYALNYGTETAERDITSVGVAGDRRRDHRARPANRKRYVMNNRNSPEYFVPKCPVLRY